MQKIEKSKSELFSRTPVLRCQKTIKKIRFYDKKVGLFAIRPPTTEPNREGKKVFFVRKARNFVISRESFSN